MVEKGASAYRQTPIIWLKHGPLRVRLLLAATSVHHENCLYEAGLFYTSPD